MRAGPRASGGPVRLRPIPGRGDNPYLVLLYEALGRAGIEVDDATSGRPAGSGAPDFVHYHWPENAIAHHRVFRQVDRFVWFFAKLALQRQRGSAIVWTFHNSANHHDASWPALLDRARQRMVAMSDIILVHFESAREHLQRVYGRTHNVWLVPHGKYAGYYPASQARSEAQRALGLRHEDLTFLLFGDLRSYKNLETTIVAFRRWHAPHARLVVAGGARTPAYAERIRTLCEGDPRIVAHLRRVPEHQVQTYFRAADVLMLPREVFSSGTAVLAYDFGLPLLAPRSNHIAALSQGSACLPLVDLSEDGLRTAFASVTQAALARARLDAVRSSAPAWDEIASGLADALREFAGRRRPHA